MTQRGADQRAVLRGNIVGRPKRHTTVACATLHWGKRPTQFKRTNFLKLLLGSSLFLLEQSDRTKNVRDRAASKIDDLRNVVQQKYEDAADRVAKASRAIRGQDSQPSVMPCALRQE